MALVDAVSRYLGGRVPGSQELDPQAQQSLARMALLNFGSSLMAGSMNPDVGAVLGTSLARGAGSYAQGVDEELGRMRQGDLDAAEEEWRAMQMRLQESQEGRAQAQEGRQGILFEQGQEAMESQVAEENERRMRLDAFREDLKKNEKAQEVFSQMGLDINRAGYEELDAAKNALISAGMGQLLPEKALTPAERERFSIERGKLDLGNRRLALDERRAEGVESSPLERFPAATQNAIIKDIGEESDKYVMEKHSQEIAERIRDAGLTSAAEVNAARDLAIAEFRSRLTPSDVSEIQRRTVRNLRNVVSTLEQGLSGAEETPADPASEVDSLRASRPDLEAAISAAREDKVPDAEILKTLRDRGYI